MLPKKNKTKTIKNIKAFFQGDTWREALIFLFFLVLSTGFWMLQTLQQTTEWTFEVPVVYTNVPENIAFNKIPPRKIELKVQDKGTVMLADKLNPKNDSITIDLSKFTPKNNVYTIPSKYIESECAGILSHLSRIISYTPGSIVIEYDKMQSKKLPVLLQGKIEPAIGFMLTDTIRFEPSEITAFGSKNVLDTLPGIYTEKIEQLKQESSRIIPVKINPVNGIKTDVSTVNLVFNIEQYTEKVVEIPVQGKNFPGNYRLRTFPATIRIICQLPLSKYRNIQDSDFEAAVFYSNTIKDNVSSAPVVITRKPEFLKNYRYIPEKVEYLIEQIQ